MKSEIRPNSAVEVDPVSRTGQAVSLLSDHWTLLILQQIFLGDRKYQDIRDAMQVSDSVLSNRLKSMVEGGLLFKAPIRKGGSRFEYRLSEAGIGTWRIFVAAWIWEQRWLTQQPGMRGVLVHNSCGNRVMPRLVCGRCLLPVTGRDTSVIRSASKLTFSLSGPRRHRQKRTAANLHDFGFLPETMELLGDRWNMALISAAVIGIRRFTDFETYLGTPPTVLAAKLARMLELGILRLQELAGSAGRTDYRLTDKGRGLLVVMMQLVRWSEEHVESEAGSSLEIIHDPCGRHLVPEFACDHCEKILKRREIHYEMQDS